ncbi:MAG: pilus assembly PilX family protein [Pseudomonadales bacterium]
MKIPGHQDGMVLVTSLVILLILTMLALSAVQGTSIQELIARNQRDSNLAFNAAETALVEAEAVLNAMTSATYGTSSSNNPKIYDARSAGSFFVVTEDPWASDYRNELQAFTKGVTTQSPPLYIIEHISTVVSDEDRLNLDNIGQNPNTCCTQMFRITARGLGGTDSAKVILQSTYGKRF